MATYSGIMFASSFSTPRGAGFQSINEVGTWQVINIAHNPGSIPISGAFINNFPMALDENTYNGNLVPSYSDFFYNRILVEPVFIDLGQVVSEQQRDVKVFNGYLTNVQLDDVVETGFDSGTTLATDTTPTTYLPLEERTHTLTVTVAGPPAIDGSWLYNFEAGVTDVPVVFFGSRIVLLPVNWRNDTTETLLFQTDVIVAHDGTEQRIKNRKAPRQQFKIKAYLDAYERQHIENLIYGWRTKQWALPIWPEAKELTAPVTQGDMIIYCDTKWADFRAGELAVLWQSPRQFDVFQIDTFTDTQINLFRGTNADYPMNVSSRVIPIRSAFMVGPPRLTKSGYDSILNVTMRVTDNQQLTTTASPIQYLGEDFFDAEPLHNGTGVTDDYEQSVTLLDYGGVVDAYVPWEHLRINRSFDLIFQGREDVWNHRLWLHRRAGKLRPFWMPTFENNMIITSIGIIGNTFTVRNDAYVAQSTGRNHIVFKMTTGEYIFREVLTSVDIDNLSSTIEIDTALNRDRQEIDEVNFIGLKRLSSDRLQLRWMSNHTIISKIPIVELQP